MSPEPAPEPTDLFAAIFAVVVMLLVFLGPFLFLLFAWLVGSWTESKHYASIRSREAASAALPAVTLRSAGEGRPVAEARLVTGHVVVSVDRFKRMLAGLRNIFGGRVRTYESLVDRARREAVLRMKEQCPEADLILNLRVETSNISQTSRDRGTGAIEVLAYGTAVRYAG